MSSSARAWTIAFAVPLVGIVGHATVVAQAETLTLGGLRAPVEIITDRWGINHIYAEYEADLFFAQGYAAARNGEMDAAQTYLASVQDLAENSTARFRFHDARELMGLSAAILEGEMKRLDGHLDGAIDTFQRAVAYDDAQPYDEPEPIPYAARHWLGAALLEAGRYAEAEQEYRTELADHPHNVWSLQGLKVALGAQGKIDADVDADYEESTARKDVWITTSIM